MSARALRIDSGNTWLYGMLNEPCGDACGMALICNPLFEERKSAHRALVETARTLCGAGWRVLRFDYRGCGDSAGAFADASVNDWEDDVAAAADVLRAGSDGLPMALLGLRLGGSLALRCAVRCRADTAALWEPVLNGRHYLQEELRKKLMKSMLTGGGNRTSRDALLEDLATDRSIDFDGYSVTPRLYRGLCEIDLPTWTDAPPPRVFLAHIAHRDQPSSSHAALRDALNARGCRAEVGAVKLQPFWNLIGYVNIAPLTHATLNWLAARSEGVRNQELGG